MTYIAWIENLSRLWRADITTVLDGLVVYRVYGERCQSADTTTVLDN